MCHLATNHWITVRIDVPNWKIEVYDSLLNALQVEKNVYVRDLQLRPLTHLFPCLLNKATYWINHPWIKKRVDEMSIVYMPDEQQFKQLDPTNCGVYACRSLDRLLSKDVVADTNLDYLTTKGLKRYRGRITRRIFKLSRREV